MNTNLCAYCGALISGSYFTVGDNYLQARFFEVAEDNIFCCTEHLLKTLSVLEVDEDGNAYSI